MDNLQTQLIECFINQFIKKLFNEIQLPHTRDSRHVPVLRGLYINIKKRCEVRTEIYNKHIINKPSLKRVQGFKSYILFELLCILALQEDFTFKIKINKNYSIKIKHLPCGQCPTSEFYKIFICHDLNKIFGCYPDIVDRYIYFCKKIACEPLYKLRAFVKEFNDHYENGKFKCISDILEKANKKFGYDINIPSRFLKKIIK